MKIKIKTNDVYLKTNDLELASLVLLRLSPKTNISLPPKTDTGTAATSVVKRPSVSVGRSVSSPALFKNKYKRLESPENRQCFQRV